MNGLSPKLTYALLIVSGGLAVESAFLFALLSSPVPTNVAWLILALSIPSAWMLGSATASHVLCHLHPPRKLPAASLDAHEWARQLILSIPVIVRSADDVRESVRSMQENHAALAGRNVATVLLVDFCDSAQKTHPLDGQLTQLLEREISELNRQCDNGVALFSMMVRQRSYNAVAAKWMGWERKRGKLEEFFKLLLGSGATSFGEQEVRSFADAAYVLVLDRDCRLLPGTVEKLIAVALHPDNRAAVRNGELTGGFAILVPRIGHRVPDRISPFFWLNEPAYSTTASTDVKPWHLWDALSEAMYFGKGLVDFRAFIALTSGVLKENAILSHDHLEGALTRVGYVSDAVVLESCPEDWIGWSARQERWMKGDVMLLRWILHGWDGSNHRGQIAWFSRYLLIENLVRHLAQLCASLMLLVAIVLSFPFYLLILFLFIRLPSPFIEPFAAIVLNAGQPLRSRINTFLEMTALCLRRSVVETLYLVGNIAVSLRAISGAFKVLYVSKRSALDWNDCDRKALVNRLILICGIGAASLACATVFQSGINGMMLILLLILIPALEICTRLAVRI